MGLVGVVWKWSHVSQTLHFAGSMKHPVPINDVCQPNVASYWEPETASAKKCGYVNQTLYCAKSLQQQMTKMELVGCVGACKGCVEMAPKVAFY